MKLDHENEMKVQEKLLSERFDEEKKRMKDRFETEMETTELRYKNRIKQLEDQIKGMSGRSQLSNAEWMEKLRKKEE